VSNLKDNCFTKYCLTTETKLFYQILTDVAFLLPCHVTVSPGHPACYSDSYGKVKKKESISSIGFAITFGEWDNTKQWPLAGEFVEFEYSPKIRQIFVTRSGEFGEY
jgi:hypothetical protein